MIRPGSVLFCRVESSGSPTYQPITVKKYIPSSYADLKADKILTVLSSRMTQGCNVLMTAEEGEVWLMQFSAFEVISRPKSK